MLIGNFMTSLFNVAKYGFFSIFLYIDSVVYKIVSMLFSVFFSLAELQLLKDDAYQAISSRIYLLVGIVALFSITISLLKALVNPDNLGKGTISSFKNLIVSMLLVILMPTIFKYAFSFQAAIINDGVINNLFNFSITTGENEMVNECNNPKDVSVNTADNETLSSEINMTVDECQANYITMTVLQAFFSPSNDNVTNNYGTTWKDARRYIWYTGDFDYIATFAEQVNKGDSNSYITYYIIITTIAGFFLGYVVLSFCLDLGIRAFKLAFYELIAPLPILMKIVPGQEGKFDKWRKEVVSTFLEVFVRLIIISFIIFMCGNLFDLIKNLSWGDTGPGLLAKAILALGLFAFAKQAPKLLKDALGLDGSGVKFGIKGKLTDVPVAGKAFAAGYGVASKLKNSATGAVSGGLGAGWSSMVNKNGFANGFRYGAAKGAKNGGNQFNSQRRDMYTRYGGKGVAGAFGGQAYFDKKADAADKAAKNDIKERFRNSQTYNNMLDQMLFSKNQEMMANRQHQVDTKKILDNYNKNISDYESSGEFSGIMASFENEAREKATRTVSEKVKSGQMTAQEGKNEVERLTNLMQKASAVNYLKEQAAKGTATEASKRYLSAVENLTSAKNDYLNAKNLQTTISEEDKELAKKATDEFFRHTDNKNKELGSGTLGKAFQEVLRSEYSNSLSNNDDVLKMAQAMKMAQAGGGAPNGSNLNPSAPNGGGPGGGSKPGGPDAKGPAEPGDKK